MKKSEVRELADILRASRVTRFGDSGDVGVNACVLTAADAKSLTDMLSGKSRLESFTIIPNAGNPMPTVCLRPMANGSVLVEIRARRSV